MQKQKKKLTPETVAAFAFLHLQRDDSFPIMPAAHHDLWLRLMTNEDIKRLLIIAPPEAAKTTWAISAYAGTYVSFYPERSVIIGSISGKVAERRSLALRGIVESQEYSESFPDVKPVRSNSSMKWQTDSWAIAPGGKPTSGRLHPTVAAYGTGGSVIGSRADLVIADDLLDFDTSRTAHQRNFVETWFHNSLLSRRKSQTGRVIVIGTAWHVSDLYSNLRRSGDWIVCHIPLKSPDERVIANISYPDKWTGETLGEPISRATTIN